MNEKPAIRLPPLGRVGRFLYDPLRGEVTIAGQILMGLAFIGTVVTVLEGLQTKWRLNPHVIDFFCIMAADIAAGFTLFILLENRVTNKESKFRDERALHYTTNAVYADAIKIASHYTLHPGHHGATIQEEMSLAEIEKDSKQWEFYGAETILIVLKKFNEELASSRDNIRENAILLSEVVNNIGNLPYSKRLSLSHVLVTLDSKTKKLRSERIENLKNRQS